MLLIGQAKHITVTKALKRTKCILAAAFGKKRVTKQDNWLAKSHHVALPINTNTTEPLALPNGSWCRSRGDHGELRESGINFQLYQGNIGKKEHFHFELSIFQQQNLGYCFQTSFNFVI